jgi:hypothetical protein
MGFSCRSLVKVHFMCIFVVFSGWNPWQMRVLTSTPFTCFQWVEPMADAGADQYTFHLEATSDDEVEGLCRKVRKFYSFELKVLRIGIRICMFLGLLDPDPDPLVPGTDPDLSIIKQNNKKNLVDRCFWIFS